MTWKVMVSAPYMRQEFERFRPVLTEADIEPVLPPVIERLSEAELLPWVGDIDGAICGDDAFTERVLRSAPQLKVISKWGTGIDSIDRGACQRLGIAVRNTPNAFSEPVADTVMGCMLAFARNVPALDCLMKGGGWQKLPGRMLQECTLGILGVGNVGKAVARRAVAFRMRVLGHDPTEPPADFLRECPISMTSKADLLRAADFVSVNCDLNPTSFHLLTDADFASMKPGVVVINTARGAIIDEAALVRALQQGQIAGAALDVFEAEPLPMDSPLRQMKNVLLSPHNSNSSPEAWERVHWNTIRNLLDVLREAQA